MSTRKRRSLRVDDIIVRNFRCIESATVDFDSTLTVLIGKNGSGKTSILDALALGLQQFQVALEVVSNRKVMLRPVTIGADERFNPDYESSILLDLDSSIDYLIGDPTWRISVNSDRSEASHQLSGLASMLNSIDSSFRKPLFVYYRQDRAFESVRPSRRLPAIEDSLEGDLRAISDLESWWDKRDAEEARTVRDSNSPEYRDPQLEAIRKVVQRIESFEDILFSSSKSPPGLYFRKSGGSIVHVSKLSSGERSYIILIADLARRLQMTMPRAEISEIPGVILIDEVELNLHPRWQSQIVGNLCQIFRSCQFIITTHSPQVVSGIPSAQVRIVNRSHDGNLVVETPLSTKGRTSNYLLEGVFEASERFPEVDRLFYDFNAAIGRRNREEAERLLDLIVQNVEGSPPDIQVLMKRLRSLSN